MQTQVMSSGESYTLADGTKIVIREKGARTEYVMRYGQVQHERDVKFVLSGMLDSIKSQQLSRSVTFPTG